MNEKSKIRAQVLQRRDEIPPEDRAQKNLDICQQLERLVAQHVEHATYAEDKPCVAVFAAMRSEVNLHAFVQTAWAHGWSVAFPCMVRDRANEAPRMAFYRVDQDQLAEARTAFLDRPLRCLPRATLAANGYHNVAPRDIDVVVAPLVAFDNAGNRLGYGGGNYDRLLPELRSDVLVVGVAFEEQRVHAVPLEPHDQPLSHIISA